ncbi:glycosyltransferase family 1 protein [Microlunatus elymi]|uniref:Glycosyltransferase family 1 protein n=1 Tax=Microlunatus elymi TaxID=2596828 RepID=A0A516PU30_9ACTN|nr:glycosyltransferase [Microlunatus elymi]QDP94652.1 glycosyltransferase family 1 protein [Microlunatus elymi]
MARILAYTPPATGHAFPLVSGLLTLQRYGHTVHVRTSPRIVDVLRRAGLETSALGPDVLGSESDNGAAAGKPGQLATGLQEVLRRGSAEMADLDAAVGAVRPDVLLVDGMAYGALTRAEAGGLPWALTLPSLLPMREPGIPPYSLGMRPARTPIGRARDAVLWPIVERAFGRALLPGINGLRREVGLPAFTSPLDVYNTPNLVIAMTGEPIEYRRHRLPGNVRMVGFQPWDPPAPGPDYLRQAGDPWILVTCSTDYQGDESLAQVVAAALAGRPYRVLITLADSYGRVDLPTAPNIFVERFAPHAAALQHAALVITHSGMGIVGKATRAGVPVVAVPFGRDQPEIARRVVEAGTGVRLPAARLTTERVRTAVRSAVALQPRAAQVAARLALTDPATDFADAVSELITSARPTLIGPAGRSD